MATFEWGLSKWDIDKAAESLNKDLFGNKKMKKRVLVPDSTVGSKDSHGAPDSDDEQLSKKARKRLKERMRKKKKRAGETADASDLNESHTKIESKTKNKQTGTKKKLDEGSTDKKTRKKKTKNSVGNSSDAVLSGETNKMHAGNGLNNAVRKKKKSNESDGKGAKPILKITEKPKKRKTPDSEMANKDLGAKKRKISDSVEENLGEPQEKKRRRPNRKKKNNSKKNKYKHLALNSQNKTDSSSGISNGEIKKVSAESESMTETPGCASQTFDKMKISHSSRPSDNDSQPETSQTSPQQKNKDKRKKTKKLKNVVVDSTSKEVSENTNQSKRLTPASKKEHGKEDQRDSRKRKENDSFKTQPRIDKQKLLNMLKNSTSDPVDQSAPSVADGSSPQGNKKTKRKRKRSQSENSSNEQSVAEKPSTPLPGSDSFVVGSLDKTPSKRLSNTAKELKDKATEKLKSARFRFINEQLYNCKGHEALQLFRKDMEAFQVYHQGFQTQTSRWPVNPLDAIIKHVNKRPKQLVVADFGCGDARLSESVPQKVHSFDLVALNDRVTACDMSKTPLADDSVDIAVFCLSLMGTNLNDYILEANRVLKTGGLLKIAEVVSRFHNPDQFIKQVSSLGFLLLNRRDLSDMFYLMDFKKVKRLKKSPFNVEIKLKPCVYKKR